MFTFIPYLLIPLIIWGYLYLQTKKETNPFIKKLITTVGSTFVIMGLFTFIFDFLSFGLGLKMILVLILGIVWALTIYFLDNRKQKNV
jgi:hypothetical protein